MNELAKPSRKPRVDRDAHSQEIHDDSHSWAVSYADFLMVLLSFFVIFFSIDDSQRSDLFENMAIDGKSTNKDKTGKLTRLPATITEALASIQGFELKDPGNRKKINLYFEDNLYRPGQLDLEGPQIQKLQTLLKKLEPYASQINITFVGHTDEAIVSKTKNRFVNDNFDLSSLRATKALQQAVKLGFDPQRMFAKGAAEFSRGSRTLSLVISPNGDDL